MFVRFGLLVLCFSSVASAQTVYTWTDQDGPHYTDDLSVVPNGVKVTTTEGTEVSLIIPSREDAGAASRRSRPTLSDPAMPSESEMVWRGLFHEANEKIRALKEEVELDRAKLEDVQGNPRTKCNWATTPSGQVVARSPCFADPNFEQTKERLQKNRSALKRAEEELEELDRQASFKSVPRNWRR